MSAADKKVDHSLQQAFFAAQFAAISDLWLQDDNLVSPDALARLETLAHAGSTQAQATLASLYYGDEVCLDGDPYLPDEALNHELGLYWAMQTSAAADCVDYTALDMARILVKSDRPDCRLRALSLALTAQTSEDHTVQYAALDLVKEHFTGFKLEEFIAAYKPAAPLARPAPAPQPQDGLF